MKFIYKNWLVHNIISHPLSEIVFMAVACIHPSAARRMSGWIHDVSLPAGAIKYEAARKGDVCTTSVDDDYGWH